MSTAMESAKASDLFSHKVEEEEEDVVFTMCMDQSWDTINPRHLGSPFLVVYASTNLCVEEKKDRNG